MTRIVVTSAKDFDDQATVQLAMLDLKKEFPNATVMTGSSAKGDQMASRVWKLLNGIALTTDPDWRRYGSEAGKMHDKHLISRGVRVCVSLLGYDQTESYLAIACARAGIEVRRYVAGQAIVNVGS